MQRPFMSAYYLLLLFSLLLNSSAHAAAAPAKKFSNYKENLNLPFKPNARYLELRRRQEANFRIDGSIRTLFNNIGRRYEIPGVMSTQELPDMGVLVGPRMPGDVFSTGDSLLIRWTSSTPPNFGEVYSLYTPAYILQNVADFTEFTIVQNNENTKKNLPEGRQIAGHLYESNGEIRIDSQDEGSGLYRATLLHAIQSITLKDRVMPLLPVYSAITPTQTQEGLNAVIVAGSPVERISAAKHSFLYINRGANDGVKVGNTFSAVESLPTIDPAMKTVDHSVGELIIIHVNDHFSTAMVTEQFEAIRIGGLLKGISKTNNKKEGFTLVNRKAVPANPGEAEPLDDPSANTADELLGLDDPEAPAREKEAQKKARELRADILGLSAAERKNLMTLDGESEEKKSEVAGTPLVDSDADAAPSNGVPSLPPPPSAFAKSATVAKKDDKAAKDKAAKAKKKSGSRDEEELNLLMQQ